MKIVSMACPHCGAALQLDADQKNLKCEYCGNSVFVDDEIKHIQIDNAEESGYLFEKGRQRAQAESDREYQQNIPAYTYEKPKKRKTWLWILGWLFIFPIPLTILIVRNQKINKKIKIIIIVIAWLVYLVMARSGKSGSSNRTKDTNESTRSSNVEASIETDTKNDKGKEVKRASDDKAEEDNGIIEPESIIIQADSTLVECDGHYMLIDEGNPSYSIFLYSYLKKRNIKYIDYIVCTHEHEDNVYWHPHDKVMDRIEKYVAQIYRTDLNGEITCISDGKEISMYFEGHNYDRTNESENYNKDSRMGE